MQSTLVSESTLKVPDRHVEGSLVELDGQACYLVRDVDAMPPFLMSLVSASDHWLFLSSNGALTAGRRDPDHALFPYYTDDRIHDSQDQTGGKTLLRIQRGGAVHLWEPFSERYQGLYRIRRNLYKSGYGNRVVFEELNLDLGLTFRVAWMNSDAFGIVRHASLRNDARQACRAEMLDGLQNVLPAGLDRRFQLEYSTLADGYKRTELLDPSGLALFRLSAIPADQAEPSEALRVNVAWSTGLEPKARFISAKAIEAFRLGLPLPAAPECRGQRGAYLLQAELDLAPSGTRDWMIVADVNQDAAQVRGLLRTLKEGGDLRARILEDAAQGTRNLVKLVASADGLQMTGDPFSSWRHFSNTLFNVMRGGVPEDQYRISREDLKAFLATANPALASRHAGRLEALPGTFSLEELEAFAAGTRDPDLERLSREYLPLTFSRRHGDPSRPWNIFSIQVKDGMGRKRLNYEGNWRDLFQNWEALGHSYPGFLTGMIFKFLDCSTVDGYNPYRVTRDGFDWETVDPEDAWSFIGYWGDHQVVYLLKLLEAAGRFSPGSLTGLLGRRVFSYADVPYRIKPYPELLADPRSTITFDQEAHARTMARARERGSDGKLLCGPGGLVRATLAEKLLLVALTKLTNYIPGAGIWMNTQRPEWNDANNALVGYGVSVVTLCYLRRYLAFCQGVFAAAPEALEVSGPLAELFREVEAVFGAHAFLADREATPAERRAMLDGLGVAGTRYREQVYGGEGLETLAPLEREGILAFIGRVLAHLDRSIRANRREDGLFHAYNLMNITGEGLEVRHLFLMLEGQVAALSSGALEPGQDLDLLDALPASALFRKDQQSYLLYPDRHLPAFLDRNNVPESALEASPLLRAMLEAGDRTLVVRDVEGLVHFNGAFRNARDLQRALRSLAGGPFGEAALMEEGAVLGIFEQVFDHQAFTGRSGAFYKYEGLGCIYWHMVSKLLLAVDELRREASPSDGARLERLNRHYREIREGIGVHKSPDAYGAIPTDPYSHTPGFAGVQQPGMTGQVKEDILSRISEMGMRIQSGRIAFLPQLIHADEGLREPGAFPFCPIQGEAGTLALKPGSFAFTFCQVPVVVHRGGPARLEWLSQDGARSSREGLELDPETSGELFRRTGKVRLLEVFLGIP